MHRTRRTPRTRLAPDLSRWVHWVYRVNVRGTEKLCFRYSSAGDGVLFQRGGTWADRPWYPPWESGRARKPPVEWEKLPWDDGASRPRASRRWSATRSAARG